MVRTTSRRYVNEDAPPVGRPRHGAGRRTQRAPPTVRLDGAIHAPPQPRAAVGRRPRTSPRQLCRRRPLRLPWALLMVGRPQGQGRGRAMLWRFVRVGLQVGVNEILVAGPPWDTTVCLWFTDRLTAPDGEVVYANRGTILAKIAWGKVTYYEVNEDTQKVAEFDEWLTTHEPTGA